VNDRSEGCVSVLNPISKIESLGFSEWFQENVDPSKLIDYRLARVITIDKNSCIITNGNKDVFAELTGKLLFNANSLMDLPAVGDWVYAQFFDDESFAVVHEILPRKSFLKRKTSGKKIEYQPLAANVDTAMIMQSLDANYNLRRLERYLAMIYESNIHPVVLLSKSDLLTFEGIEKRKSDIYKLIPTVPIVAFSNKNETGLDQVKELLMPGKTFCLLGSSGVGKTTLLNNLLNKALFETQAVREKDGRGRQTTARRQLIFLEDGAMIIDTPGMRELGMMGMESGLDDTFDEIAQLSDQCRFKNCTHTVEEGCAVLASLNEGAIDKERYQNYVKMRRESAYHGMSYIEKRRKDKQFGKLCKSVMKHKKKDR
jgi:ribosome biogenesis GTPase